MPCMETGEPGKPMAECAAPLLRQFSSERDVGSEIKCLSGENLDCKQWPSRRSSAERGRERERCYTIAKCVYLEGNSGGSKMKGESDQFMLNTMS